MSAGTILKAALQYAARGWPVFPCGHDKKPLTPHGFKDATTDAAKINAWWTHWPGAAIGIDCGGARLLVVDCDVKHGVDGIAAFEALGIAHGEALHSRTPSGGLHILFSQNGTLLGSTAGRLAPGVDTRGAGGYIVAPPSHVDAGDYEPLDDWSREPAKVPAALSQLLAPPCPAPTPPAPTPPCPAPTPRGDPWATAALRAEAARLAATPPGARNAALNQAAFNLGQLVAAGYLSNAEVTDALTAAARACGLEADDGARAVAATIASGLQASATRPRYKPLRRAARAVATRARPVQAQAPEREREREREAPAQIPLATIQKALEENERGDADLLVQLAAGKWIFDYNENRWYQFVGPGWRADSAGALYDKVNRDVAAQYLRLAADYRQRGDGEHERAALARAMALRSRRRADNVLFLASHPTLAFMGQWDADPWALGVANGVLDLHTGKLRPGRPEDWIKSLAPTAYDAAAACPRWLAFLEQVLPDPEARAFLWRFLGYALTGSTRDHIFPILWGDGRNGKGTLLEVLAEVLGPALTASTQADAIMDTGRGDGNAPRPFVYGLRGKRLVWASESNEGRRINAGLIKQLTGGDRLNVRTLHSLPVEFKATHKLLLLTNNKPHIPADDQAAWDRTVLVPFTQRFVDHPAGPNEHARDPDLKQALLAEASGILGWLVRGCLEWQSVGLEVPESLRQATASYREDEDTVGQFLAECCLTGPRYRARSADLYAAYRQWAGDSAMSQTAFSMRLKRRGFEVEHDRNGAIYLAVGLRQ